MEWNAGENRKDHIMMAKAVIGLLMLSTLYSCKIQPKTAQQIVDKSIEAHGGDRYTHSTISFDFRGRHYIAKRDGGKFTYHRQFADSTGSYDDVLSNDGFKRIKNGSEVDLSPKLRQDYTNSVNSVVYFALLPYFLNDAAVQKKLLGETTIDGKDYYKIKVTFHQEGGGVDHDDEYAYWINTQTFTLDFLAYSFHVDGGGLRFRKATNPRTINGIRFQDYINYEYGDQSTPVEKLDGLFKNDQLKKLSEIDLENVQVVLE